MTSISRLSFQLLSRTPRRPLRPRSPAVPLIPKRYVGIPPAFLLDEYLPRYQMLSSVDCAKKRSRAYAHLRECNLCPRRCGVNRYETTGVCLIGAETAKVNVIAPHRGEEPCIQGYHGSGSVFFSGCNLRCVFCQNHVCTIGSPPFFFLSLSLRLTWLPGWFRTSRINETDSTSRRRNLRTGT